MSARVSCIMPTQPGREVLREHAIKSLRDQTYLTRELIILAMPTDAHVLSVMSGLGIGELRNVACRAALGSIIAHWDDDDVSSPDRLERSVKAIKEGADLVGSSLVIYTDGTRRWLWDGSKLTPKHLCGGTFVYRRSLWERQNFPDVMTGEDARWFWHWQTNGARIVDLADETLYTATIHDGNTSKKDVTSIGWTELP